jgi:hypothetical protein
VFIDCSPGQVGGPDGAGPMISAENIITDHLVACDDSIIPFPSFVKVDQA